ncbi:unnamed protein product [Symbiodinium sp. CCMP2592]|nr:unnamed protein product [Symbiodinium sp. CCMP2592]
MAMSSRRSNGATGKDLMKTFRGNLQAVEAGDALLSLDAFCKKHHVLMKEILGITTRPTAAVMRESMSLVWPGAPSLELKTFANHLHEVYKTLFTKTRNMSTGGRLADSIHDMCFFIKDLLGLPESSARSPKASPKKKIKQRLDSTCQKASTRKLEVHVSASSSDAGATVKKEPAEAAEPASHTRDGPRPLPTGQISKLYQQAASAASFFHTDLSVPTVLRIAGDSREAAKMHKGPSGFAVAVWSDGHQIVSEIPNLLLDKAAAAKASPKGKAKAASKKKPAAVIKKPACFPQEDGESPVAGADDAAAGQDLEAPAEAALVPVDAPAADDDQDPNYGDVAVLPANAVLRKEYRAANNTMAFRMIWRNEKNKECKRQMFQLKGGSATTKEQLHATGEEALRKARAGEPLAQVRSWAEEQLSSMQP